jgi:hypothetical protein
MGLVALSAGIFAVGAYLGRNLSPGCVLAWWIASFSVPVGTRSDLSAYVRLFFSALRNPDVVEH